jgi:sulfur relay protein TusB/DsrH
MKTLFLISSAPDTTEFRTAYRTAREMHADVCLLQSAVYASRKLDDKGLFVMSDDMHLRGIGNEETTATVVDYNRLVDMITEADKVIGIF